MLIISVSSTGKCFLFSDNMVAIIYIFEDQTWGVIYFLHGFAALFLVTTVMLHIYFSLRPEKWMYLRSMLKGWITDKELKRHHDKKEWAGD